MNNKEENIFSFSKVYKDDNFLSFCIYFSKVLLKKNLIEPLKVFTSYALVDYISHVSDFGDDDYHEGPEKIKIYLQENKKEYSFYFCLPDDKQKELESYVPTLSWKYLLQQSHSRQELFEEKMYHPLLNGLMDIEYLARNICSDEYWCNSDEGFKELILFIHFLKKILNIELFPSEEALEYHLIEEKRWKFLSYYDVKKTLNIVKNTLSDSEKVAFLPSPCRVYRDLIISQSRERDAYSILLTEKAWS